MPRPSSESLTKRESQIMQILWDLEQATAEEIRERLSGQPHDSSVRTLLRVLKTKGYVRYRTEGKAYVYRPAVVREKVQKKAISSLLKQFFGGSSDALLLHLLEQEQITPEQLEELKKTSKSKTSSTKSRKKRTGEEK